MPHNTPTVPTALHVAMCSVLLPKGHCQGYSRQGPLRSSPMMQHASSHLHERHQACRLPSMLVPDYVRHASSVCLSRSRSHIADMTSPHATLSPRSPIFVGSTHLKEHQEEVSHVSVLRYPRIELVHWEVSLSHHSKVQDEDMVRWRLGSCGVVLMASPPYVGTLIIGEVAHWSLV